MVLLFGALVVRHGDKIVFQVDIHLRPPYLSTDRGEVLACKYGIEFSVLSMPITQAECTFGVESERSVLTLSDYLKMLGRGVDGLHPTRLPLHPLVLTSTVFVV